jgi:pyruvate/2-oxoglutarate/acetoin dehydrogenase E1 component
VRLVLAQIGKGVLRREGKDVALIGYGTMVQVRGNSCMGPIRQSCS